MPTPARDRPRALGLLGLGLVLVVLAGLVAALVVEHHDRQRLAAVQDSSGPAMTAARKAARTLFSYDAAHLQADLDRALPLTTAPYTDTYRTAARAVLWPAATAGGSVVTADVRQVGATGATTSSTLVALVLLDSSTSRAGAAATVDRVELRMTLVRRSGSWRVSGVTSL